MAVDVPSGLVDFVEIMSLGETGTSTWFDFLNLGFRLPPAAGTDYPLLGVLGAMRSYVQIGPRFTPQAWFDELKNGRTFVTTGPMLEISVNGQGMGSQVHVRSGTPLQIEARAALDAGLEGLASLELIEQGEVVKTVSSPAAAPEMELRQTLTAKHGTWFVLRARGKNADLLALSGPIYVLVDGQSFWKPAAVPAIVAKLKSKLRETLELGPQDMTDRFETQESFAKQWDEQRERLEKRIDQANAIYDGLVQRATTRPCQVHTNRSVN